MIRLLRRIILLSFTCFCTIKSFAQLNESFVPQVFAKSPTSASFTKYGEYPMHLYSGLPNISIPLYTIESGGLSVPITLSYHASGIKVEQVASWVGLGWTLNAGGAVTRNIQGLADDGGNGYFNYYNRAISIDVSQQSQVSMLYNTVTGNSYDNRPDIYTYDFPGQNGKFFFNAMNNYSIEKIPYSPVDIKNTATNFKTDTAKFYITDEHGNGYQFGYNYKERTTTSSASSRPATTAVTSWLLEQMLSQNKHDTIRFTYTNQIYKMPLQIGESLSVEDNDSGNKDNLGPEPYPQNNWTPVQSNTSTTVDEKDPREIFFKNGKVVFNLADNARVDVNEVSNPKALKSIQVFAYDFSKNQYESQPQKTIIFKTSSFSVMSGTMPRMRLDSMQVLDKAGSVTQTYRFTYNTTPLPVYTSYSKDYWGYYNGKMDDPNISPKTLIPKTRVFGSFRAYDPGNTFAYDRYIGSNDSTSRNPDTVKMQAGILTRIDYPTGGHTDFTYSTNRYTDAQSIVRFTGGLRVNTITSYADATATTPIVKTYKYNTAIPNFITDPSTGYLKYGYFCNTNGAAWIQGEVFIRSKRVRTFYSESSGSLTPTEGNPVAYTFVTEYIGDPVTNIGKTEYYYKYNGDTYSGASAFTQRPVILDRYFSRGQLASKTDYLRKADGSYQIVKDQITNYSAFKDTMYNDVGLIVGQRRQSYQNGSPILWWWAAGSNSNDAQQYPFSAYNIVSGDSYPISMTTRLYDQNDPSKFTSTTVEYKYENFRHQQVSRIRKTDSKGNLKVVVRKYPADYIQMNTAATGNNTLDAMLAANMQAEPIEKWDSVKNVNTSLNTVVGAQLNLYQLNGQTVLPASIKKLNIPSPITNFSPATVTSGNITSDSRYVQMIAFDNYKVGDNALLQYTPRNAGPTSVIWDYNGQYPSAQIKNAVYSNIAGNKINAYTSFETNNGGNWIYTAKPVTARYAPTGKLVFPLSQGNISTNGFDLAKPHILSYWSDNGAANVYAGSAVPGKALRTVNGWTLYRHDIPAAGAGVNISISGSGNIDELKTYPVDAQMSTYTFDADGLSAIADEKDQILRFEYDPAQRLQFTRDWQNNIIKAYDYHNYDMTFGNDAIAATTFTRDNCPAGTSPQSTTYAIAANSFYSSSKASANALAQYYLQQEGQKKANDPAVCGCPIQYVTISFKDQTGLGTYQAVFSGTGSVTYNIPSGTSTKQVPAGTYTLQINAVGTQSKNFSLTGYSTVTGRTATFNTVNVSAAGPALTLTIY